MTAVDEFLEHFGVKGMKWGVRKDNRGAGKRASQRKINRLDKKFERNTNTLATALKVYNRAAELSNTNDVARINNKPQYRRAAENGDFLRDTPLRRQYYQEHQDALTRNLRIAAGELGTNASGTRRYEILEGEGGNWSVTAVDVRHAVDPNRMNFKITFDKLGQIVRIDLAQEDLVQTSVIGEEFLEHYGVKGMKWGVHRSRSDKATKSNKRGPKKDKPDPTKLSDQELRAAVNRMQLERQYTSLSNASSRSAGAEFARSIATNVARTAITGLATQQVNAALRRATGS